MGAPRRKAQIFFPEGFPEELLKPLPKRRRVGLLQMPAHDPDYDAEYRRRLELLFHYYGIDPLAQDAIQQICGALMTLLPGFCEDGRGAKRKFEKYLWRKELLSAVTRLKKKDDSLDDEAACKILSSARSTECKTFRGENPRTLRTELSRARKEAAQRSVSPYKEFLDAWPSKDTK